MRAAELLVFASLAAGVHIGAFSLWSGGALSPANGGEGGAQPLSIQGAPAELVALVQEWDSPPAAITQAPAEPALERPSDAVALPADIGQQPALPPPAPEHAAPEALAPLALALPPVDALSALATVPVPPAHQESTARAQASEQPRLPQATRPAAMRTPADMDSPAIEQDSAQIAPQAPDISARPQMRPALEVAKAAQPAPRAKAAPPKSRAAGTGATAKAATGSTPKATGPKSGAGQLAKLEAVWGSAVQSKVQRNARSPGTAKARVQVSIRVAPSGKLLAANVVRSSGQAMFDKAALQAVKRARRFPAAPKALRDRYYTFVIPIRFN